MGYGIRAQEGFLRSQNTKGRCQPSNLSLLRTIARCLHRNHPVIFNPETNGDEKNIMMIHNAIMLSTCNLFQKPRHIHKTSAPDRPWHCKTLAGAKPLEIATIATIAMSFISTAMSLSPHQAHKLSKRSAARCTRRSEGKSRLALTQASAWKQREISRATLQVRIFCQVPFTNPTIRELSKHFTIIHNHSQNRCITCPTHLSLHIS